MRHAKQSNTCGLHTCYQSSARFAKRQAAHADTDTTTDTLPEFKGRYIIWFAAREPKSQIDKNKATGNGTGCNFISQDGLCEHVK